MTYTKKHDYIYMAVTADEYELPIMFEDTLQLLADRLGMKSQNLKTSLAHRYSGTKKGYRFARVDVIDTE